MKPKLANSSGADEILNKIVSCISGIDCSKYFSNHLGQSQSGQNTIVSDFQSYAESVLVKKMSGINWSMEHRPSKSSNDRIDIFGKGNGFVVAIELDKHRADQVAKKFVSRMAILAPTRIYFISLCYPGTKKMNKSECVKYFSYCSDLARRMSNHYAGFIIEKKT